MDDDLNQIIGLIFLGLWIPFFFYLMFTFNGDVRIKGKLIKGRRKK